MPAENPDRCLHRFDLAAHIANTIIYECCLCFKKHTFVNEEEDTLRARLASGYYREEALAGPDLQEERSVTCPCCQGSGGTDIGVGSLDCTLCSNSGEVSAKTADRFARDNAFWAS